jgi:hypothetical protein
MRTLTITNSEMDLIKIERELSKRNITYKVLTNTNLSDFTNIKYYFEILVKASDYPFAKFVAM